MLPEGAPVAFELVATIHSFASRVFVTAADTTDIYFERRLFLEQRPSRDDFGFLGRRRLRLRERRFGSAPVAS
jgi:hypothetical protein